MLFTLRIQCLGHWRRLWEDWGKKDRETLSEVTCQAHTARRWQSRDMCPGLLVPGSFSSSHSLRTHTCLPGSQAHPSAPVPNSLWKV